MSATLRVEDFVQNRVLFPVSPPLIQISARQHPVTVHFSRKTNLDYLSEAFKKISKIHSRLPEGGILVFLSGQNEIHALTKKLKKRFPFNSNAGEEKDVKSGILPPSSLKRTHDAKEDEDLDEQIPDADPSPNEIMEMAEDRNVEEFEIDENESDDDDDDEFGELSDTKDPLYVLPLYALLPTEQQMKVFKSPPPGSRLCVLATNVAETSLTIPNIKYVVDCGKVKERKYCAASKVQSFEVGWTSKASAQQRTGRAGRTGPGHCYRLYSSAVYENEFEEFSKPEINRIPIEGVYLQMKSMHIDSIVNFPFPSAPDKSRFVEAEKLLVWLGALERESLKITSMGRKMASFPLSPRYSKMLLIGLQNKCLDYAINLVAALSVGDPFIRDQGMEESEKEEEMDRKNYYQVHAMFAGDPADSDALKLFHAFGAFEYSGHSEKFCESHYLRYKPMREMMQLKRQLIGILKSMVPSYRQNRRLKPPGPNEKNILRQIILAGFIDQVSQREGSQAMVGSRVFGYHGIGGDGKERLLVHPHSCLYARCGRKSADAPEFIVYEDLVRSSGGAGDRVNMKGITVVDRDWIARIAGPSNCSFGKALEVPQPRYDETQDCMVYSCTPVFGRDPSNQWSLPVCERRVSDLISLASPDASNRSRQADLFYRHFCRELLSGRVITVGPFGEFSSKLVSNANVMLKPWTVPKVVDLLVPIKQARIMDKRSLLDQLKKQPNFLLKGYLAWIPDDLQDAVRASWPQLSK